MVIDGDEVLADGTWVVANPAYLYGWHDNVEHVKNEVFGRILTHRLTTGDKPIYWVQFMIPPDKYPGEWRFLRDVANNKRLTATTVTEKRERRWMLMVMKS